MSNAILFLDIDGVLNRTPCVQQGLPRIDRDLANRVNRIIYDTDASVVLSSTWRGWVLKGWMTTIGMQCLLGTHAIDCDVVGVLPEGDKSEGVRNYIRMFLPASYVVIDDHEISGVVQVKTNGLQGISETDADSAIAILKASQPGKHDIHGNPVVNSAGGSLP